MGERAGTGLTLAGLHFGLDDLFQVLYPLLVALGRDTLHWAPRPQSPGSFLGRCLLDRRRLLAGLLDALENSALLALLLGHPASR